MFSMMTSSICYVTLLGRTMPYRSHEIFPLNCFPPLRLSVTRRAGVIRAQGRVGSASEFGQTWLQQAGRCADSSFSSRILVTDRGLVARCDGGKGSEEGNYECGVGSVTRR